MAERDLASLPGRGRRATPLRGALLGLLLGLLLGAGWYGWPPVRSSHGRFDRGANAVWFEHGWLAATHPPEAYRDLVARMRRLGVRTLYPHLCPMQPDGSLPEYSAESLRRLLAAARAPDPAGDAPLRVLPWVSGAVDGTVRLADSRQAERFAAECARLVHEECADGIHLNIEPSLPSERADFYRLLDRLRAALGAEKCLSVAAYPPPTRRHPYPAVHWDRATWNEVARRADELAVMAYDTGLRSPARYRRLVADWTEEALDWSAAANPQPRVLIGVPTYGEDCAYHRPEAECLRHAVAGVNLGLERLSRRARAGEAAAARALALADGLALYRDRTTDPHEWREYRWLWRGELGWVPPRPDYLDVWLGTAELILLAGLYYLLGRTLAAPEVWWRLGAPRLARPVGLFAALAGTLVFLWNVVPFFLPALPPPGLPVAVQAAGFLLLGAATRLITSREQRSSPRLGVRRDRTLLLLLGGLLVLTLVTDEVFLWLNGPEVGRFNGRVAEGAVFQSAGYTCLPAAGAAALAAAGVETDEGELAWLCGTTFRGTAASRLDPAARRLARAQGLALEVRAGRFSFEELRRLDAPAVLDTKYGNVSHATALLGFEGERAVLGEPQQGRRLATEAELRREWQWRGAARVLLVRRPDSSRPPPVALADAGADAAVAKAEFEAAISPPRRALAVLILFGLLVPLSVHALRRRLRVLRLTAAPAGR